MLKKLAPMLLFNVLVSLMFIFSSINLWDIINSTVSKFSPTYVLINDVSINPLFLSIGQLALSNGAINLGPLPLHVPNYTFILFWVAMLGNLFFVIMTLRSRETKQNTS